MKIKQLRVQKRFWSFISSLFLAVSVSGQSFTVVHSFSGEGVPYGPLVEGDAGTLYGTTINNPTNNAMVFKCDTNHVLTKLVGFQDTNNFSPYGLMFASDGSFYGAAAPAIDSGRFGILYHLTTNGAYTPLVTFNGTNGGLCYVPLAIGSDSNIYGTTINPAVNYTNIAGGWGTSRGGNGTVFRMTPAGELTTLVNFDGTNGSRPNGVIQASDGNLYGTTLGGGTFNLGTIYQVTLAGSYRTLLSFDGTNGANPTSQLVQGLDGKLYGTTEQSGGTVFKVTLDGTFTSVAVFQGANGRNPSALICGLDGNLYGTTFSGGSFSAGTLFRITPEGVLTTLINFDVTNGGYPDQLPPFQARNGLFYGMTLIGGAASSGVIYQVELFPKFLAIGKTVLGDMNLIWSALSNRTYQLQSTTNLQNGTWTPIPPDVTATGKTVSFTNGVDGSTQRFYRVKLLP